jgi:hypothetical protein
MTLREEFVTIKIAYPNPKPRVPRNKSHLHCFQVLLHETGEVTLTVTRL